MGIVTGAISRAWGSAARRLSDTGYKRGLQGSGIWLAVGVSVSALRMLNKMSKRTRTVVYSAELEPGATLNIVHLLEDHAGRAVEIRGRTRRVARVRK